jgi:hypothetical protein
MYDYGQRNYMPDVGRFNRPDRFSEKYFDKSVYSYAANNPIMYIDLKRDSLVLHNNIAGTAISKLKSNTESGLGCNYTLTTSSSGKYYLSANTTAGSSLSNTQMAFLNTMNEVMNSTSDVSFDVVDHTDTISQNIYVGDNGRAVGASATPNKHTLDVDDMDSFGTGGLLTKHGALAHEIKEGYDIQAQGLAPNVAHNNGINSENAVNGTTSLGATLSPSGVITIPVNYTNSTGTLSSKNVGLQFINGQLLQTNVTNNTK